MRICLSGSRRLNRRNTRTARRALRTVRPWGMPPASPAMETAMMPVSKMFQAEDQNLLNQEENAFHISSTVKIMVKK